MMVEFTWLKVKTRETKGKERTSRSGEEVFFLNVTPRIREDGATLNPVVTLSPILTPRLQKLPFADLTMGSRLKVTKLESASVATHGTVPAEKRNCYFRSPDAAERRRIKGASAYPGNEWDARIRKQRYNFKSSLLPLSSFRNGRDTQTVETKQFYFFFQYLKEMLSIYVKK